MPWNSEQLGRTTQKVGVFTARQQATISVVSGLVLAAVLWHVTVVLLAGVPFGRASGDPPGRDSRAPAGRPEPAVRAAVGWPGSEKVWLGLLVLVAGSWIGLRLWLSGRRTQRRRGVVREGMLVEWLGYRCMRRRTDRAHRPVSVGVVDIAAVDACGWCSRR